MRLYSLHCLVVHLGRLDMSRHGIREVSKFANICSSVDINSLRVIVERGICGGEVGWKTAIHRRVHQFSALCKEEFADVVKCQTRLFHRVRHSHSLEVAAMVDFACFAINKWVICGCVQSGESEVFLIERYTSFDSLELHSMVIVARAERISSTCGPRNWAAVRNGYRSCRSSPMSSEICFSSSTVTAH